ncbi:MAG TPA: ATP-dependent zinc metalloprotease FtsH, partial [Ilumatobacteraceae bacterium]|nr:ATP-dependent zinc metalloprotease FtsH [Ilumatobacteraceae bacterium]
MSNLPPPPPPPPQGRGQQPGQQPPEQGPGRRAGGWPRWTIPVLLAVLVGTLVLNQVWPNNDGENLSYTEMMDAVAAGQVAEITVTNGSNTVSGEFVDGTEFTSTVRDDFPDASEREVLEEHGVDWSTKTPESNWLLNWASLLLPFLLIIGFLVWMNRRAAGQMGNVMSIGRSRAKAYSADKPSTTFADIAGYDGVKQEITEVVDFLRMPERFREIGARVPKGMLLVGPPGTGKTLLARAVAGEAGVGFLSVTGSDFMEMFVGVGASRVRDLFQQARKMGRAIIFIDEIDSIGRKRGAGLGGGHDEREQTLNQMLAEMDGFETSEGIVILAATNRPDILDPALLRPGRFDRQIVVPLPEFEERKAILEVHSRDKRMGPDVDLSVMAKATPGMSGADLANLVNEAALVAVRRGSKEIERIDFENARDRVVLGALRESMVLSVEERRATAYHEGGHAILATVLPHGDPLHKVTILPRGMALGVTQTLPEERHSYSKEYIEDRICMALGGRVAEQLVFAQQTT